MDESFQLRARRLLGKRQTAALDYAMLTAALAAERAMHAASRRPEPACDALEQGGGDPLTEIVLAGPGWQSAASAQRGCFNRAESVRRRNGP
jgi:hypothetical protein